MPNSNDGRRLVRIAFSNEEWAVLEGCPEFVDRVNTVNSIEEADLVIRGGAEILETKAAGKRADEKARLDGPSEAE